MKYLHRIFLLCLFLLSSCVSSTNSIDDRFWPEYSLQPRTQPVIIAIDKDFSEEEEKMIAHAFEAWKTASSGKVFFIPVWNVQKPGWYKNQIPLKLNQGIFLWDLPRTYSHLTPEEKEQADKLLGVCVYGPGNNSAHVIVYSEIDKYKFYSVVLHEIGHLIGLLHVEQKGVMHKNAISNCITQYDAEQLCSLYGCVPKPECHI